MKRLFVLTVLALMLGAGSAFAQTNPSTSKNTSIRQSIAAAVANTTLARSTATPVRVAAAGKSFWHTPWPYVIFGAAAVVVVVATHKGSSGTGGY